MYHFCQSLVSNQQIPNERKDYEQSVGRSGQGHSGKPLDEGGHEVTGKVGRGQENVGHVEEAGTILDVQNFGLKRSKIV